MGWLDRFKLEWDDFRSQKMFPMYFLTGSLILAAVTSDILWVYIGVGGFAFMTIGVYFLD